MAGLFSSGTPPTSGGPMPPGTRMPMSGPPQSHIVRPPGQGAPPLHFIGAGPPPHLSQNHHIHIRPPPPHAGGHHFTHGPPPHHMVRPHIRPPQDQQQMPPVSRQSKYLENLLQFFLFFNQNIAELSSSFNFPFLNNNVSFHFYDKYRCFISFL